MKFDFELIFVFAGFVGWICFFIQRAKAKRQRQMINQQSELLREMLALNQRQANLSLHWRKVAWLGVLCLWIIAAVEAWKRWKASR